MSSATLTLTANLLYSELENPGTTLPASSDGAVKTAHFDVKVGCDRQE